MSLWNKLFGRPEPRPSRRQDIAANDVPTERKVYVSWPDGEDQHVTIDVARLDPKLLGNTHNLLTALSYSESVVRGSVVTGRVQTLTRLVLGADDAVIRGVHISSDLNETLIVTLAIADTADRGAVKAALENGLDKRRFPRERLESVLRAVPEMPAIVVIAFGPKTDPVIDEAFGLALYLGAALPGDDAAPATPAA